MELSQNELDQLRKRDKTAFKQLVETHKKPLYFFLLKILKNPDITHDVFQDVFIKVYRNIHTFKGQSSLKTWIFQIASNTALNELKKIQRQQAIAVYDYQKELEATEETDEELFKVHLSSAIEKALMFLTPTQQLIFKLRRLNGMSTRETSEHLRCSEANVKKQLYLAMNKVRAFFKKNYPDVQWY